MLLLGIGLSLLTLSTGFVHKAMQIYNATDYRDDMPPIKFNEPSAEQQLPSLIRLHDLKTGRFFCSGTVISANYAVTAAHCLEGRSRRKPSIAIKDINNNDTPITAIAGYYEGRSDLGLLIGDFSKFQTFQATVDTQTIVSILEDSSRIIVSCGFPYGGAAFCHAIANVAPFDSGFIGIGYMYPGMSGGPVMDYATRTLVGVNTGTMDQVVYISPVVEVLTAAKVKVEGQP